MLNNCKICPLAFTTSSLQPRVRAETCSVTTAPSPELSIIGTPFKSSTIRPLLAHASRIASFNSGTFSLVSRPKHSTTEQSCNSFRSTRNPRDELAASFAAIPPSAIRRRAHSLLYAARRSLPIAHGVCTSFPPVCPERESPPAGLFPRARDAFRFFHLSVQTGTSVLLSPLAGMNIFRNVLLQTL